MKKVMLLGLALLLVATPVFAAEFLAPGKDGDPNISTAASETKRNLYAGGATVNINGNTQGDLFVAGGVVTVNGSVEDDLFAAGGNVNLNSTVGGNLRAAGGNISISSPVGEDLLVAGGNVALASKTVVNGDLVAAGGNLVIDSDVRGKATISGGTITINGKILGTVEIMAEEQLVFGSTAEVLGKITYKGRKEAVVKEGAKVGTIAFTQTKGKHGSMAGFLTVFTLIKFLMVLLTGWVFHRLFSNKIYTVVARAKEVPWHSLGIGLVVFIVTPILAGLLCVTVVGFVLGVALFLMYALVMLVACVLTNFYVGNLVYGWFKKDAQASWIRDLALGCLILIVLGLIPFVGWLAVFVAYMITLGSLAHHYKTKKEQLMS